MNRSTRANDYDFGPYEDEYRGFDTREDDSARGPLILILALGVLLIFAGVVWNTYRQGVRPAEGGLPVIAADDAPYKRAPDERGGLQVAGQEQGFYASMDGLGDPAEQQKFNVRNPVEIRRNDQVLKGGPAPADLPPVPVGEAMAELQLADESVTTREEGRPIKVAAVQTPIESQSRQPAVPEIAAALVEPVEATPSKRFSKSGEFQIQLSALRSEEAALSAWSSIKGSAPDLYMGAELDIQRADLGAKGVFYRLRVGSFEDRDSAKGFCAEVKATGKDCMVVSRSSG